MFWLRKRERSCFLCKVSDWCVYTLCIVAWFIISHHYRAALYKTQTRVYMYCCTVNRPSQSSSSETAMTDCKKKGFGHDLASLRTTVN